MNYLCEPLKCGFLELKKQNLQASSSTRGLTDASLENQQINQLHWTFLQTRVWYQKEAYANLTESLTVLGM